MTPTGRRATIVLLAVAALAAPAAVLRMLCVGSSCERPAGGPTRVPFCSLPEDLRAEIQGGYRDGRSPEVLMVTRPPGVAGSTGLRDGPLTPAWPTLGGAGERVPVAFWGTGIAPGSIEVPITLADVAPTVASVIGLDRPHPGVRSGVEVEGVAGGSARPRLVLEVILEGLGSDDLAGAPPPAWSTLRSLMNEGASTFDAGTGSLPLDPAAAVATIGTGGLPSEHGITGTLVRNDRGRLVRAWGRGAPFSVIAALGDDLDQLEAQRPSIGLVGTDVSDRGAIGGDWYVDNDRDDVVIRAGPAALQAEAAERLLGTGYGADATTDLIVVAMDDRLARVDRALSSLLDTARRIVGDGLTVVVAGTGSEPAADGAVSDRIVERRVDEHVGQDVVEATAVGGLFLDQGVLAEAGLSKDVAVRAGLSVRAGGEPLLADAFPGIAVTLARYC